MVWVKAWVGRIVQSVVVALAPCVGAASHRHGSQHPRAPFQGLTLVASCLRGALPPVDLRAVCLVRAMAAACFPVWLLFYCCEGSVWLPACVWVACLWFVLGAGPGHSLLAAGCCC